MLQIIFNGASRIHALVVCKERKFVFVLHLYFMYRIAGKFGKFGELSVIHQTKTITYNYYLMAEFMHSPNFSSPNAHNQ